MLVKEVKPYGYWNSPITAELITQGTKRFGNIVIDGDKIYWDEMRPSEKGRSLIVCEEKEITPPGMSVRTRVNEYGGKAYTVAKGIVYFVNDKDQRIYVQNGDKVSPLTEQGPHFADLCMCEAGLIAVCEYAHENSLVLIDLSTGKYTVLASGFDFYSSPVLSPDKKAGLA